MLLHDYTDQDMARIQPVIFTFDYFLRGQKINYVVTPVSTGFRYLEWYKSEGAALTEDKPQFRRMHYDKVIAPNRVDALNSLLELPQELLSFCPASIFFPDWSHADHMRLYTEVIKKYAKRLVLLHGWQCSLGCIIEFTVAVQHNLPCYALAGEQLDYQQALISIRDVVPRLIEVNLPVSQIQQQIEQIDNLLAARVK